MPDNVRYFIHMQMQFNLQNHNAKLETKEEEPLERHLKLTEHSQIYTLQIKLPFLYKTICASKGNEIGPEGGRAIGEALKENHMFEEFDLSDKDYILII